MKRSDSNAFTNDSRNWPGPCLYHCELIPADGLADSNGNGKMNPVDQLMQTFSASPSPAIAGLLGLTEPAGAEGNTSVVDFVAALNSAETAGTMPGILDMTAAMPQADASLATARADLLGGFGATLPTDTSAMLAAGTDAGAAQLTTLTTLVGAPVQLLADGAPTISGDAGLIKFDIPAIATLSSLQGNTATPSASATPKTTAGLQPALAASLSSNDAWTPIDLNAPAAGSHILPVKALEALFVSANDSAPNFAATAASVGALSTDMAQTAGASGAAAMAADQALLASATILPANVSLTGEPATMTEVKYDGKIVGPETATDKQQINTPTQPDARNSLRAPWQAAPEPDGDEQKAAAAANAAQQSPEGHIVAASQAQSNAAKSAASAAPKKTTSQTQAAQSSSTGSSSAPANAALAMASPADMAEKSGTPRPEFGHSQSGAHGKEGQQNAAADLKAASYHASGRSNASAQAANEPAPSLKLVASSAPATSPTVEPAPPILTPERLLGLPDGSSGTALAAGLTGMRGESTFMTSMGLMGGKPSPEFANQVAQQLNVGVTKAINGGKQEFTMQLRPGELGHVRVKMSFLESGRIQAQVMVERPETLELLQRDVRGLERAIEASGHKTEGSIQFSLDDNNQQSAGKAFAEAVQQEKMRDELAARSGGAFDEDADVAEEDVPLEDILPHISADTGLDIRV